MSSKEDWKKIEEYMQNKDIEDKMKYKVDIHQDINQKYNKMKKFKNFGKISIVISIVILLFTTVNSIYLAKNQIIRISNIKGLGFESEESAIKTDLFGNGFYTYKLKAFPEIEVHCVFFPHKDLLITDLGDRLHKYFFEKWDDTAKDKFVPVETYSSYKFGYMKKSDWILDYHTYIEVNNYDEMLVATEDIIRFSEYISNGNTAPTCLIKIDNKFIQPKKGCNQTAENIRKCAIAEYNKLFGN